MYFETAAWLISMPSFNNSPCIRGAPQGGLARDIVRINSRISGETLGFFYAMHSWMLPSVAAVFMGMHFVMIRRTGISKPL